MKGKLPLREKTGQVDFILLLIILALALFGFVMLFSASAPLAARGGVFKTFVKQGIILLVGMAAMLGIMCFDYHNYRKINGLIMVTTMVVMVIVLFAGYVSHGARRQIAIGSFSIQPSEFAKYALVIYYATILSDPKKGNITTNKRNIFEAMLLLGILCATCYAQKHLSATIVIAAIGASMLILAGLSKKTIMRTALVCLVALPFLVMRESYRISRITAFLDPFKDKQGDGWQIVQSLLAVGSGGLFGLGLGQSRQKYSYLPEAQNDYLYAVICEELGFIGGVIVILLFAAFVWRGMYIALKAKDKMGMLIAFGVSFIVGIQMLVNIGVVLSVIPSTGMQLPLFSSGGSSLIATMIGMGMILNVSKSSRIKKL